jgi:acetyl/propionyl-CoA carboxylase alpha subunit
LQVEHPITEAITGLDLVALQLAVARGESLQGRGLDALKINVRFTLTLSFNDKGHAIEARLYAEDPNNSFFPCIGKILSWQQMHAAPGSLYPRYDTGVRTGSTISVFYDPMIAKIVTWAPSRREAIHLMEQTLRETVCLGLVTNKRLVLHSKANISFMMRVLKNEMFLKGTYTTHLVDAMIKAGQTLGFDVSLLAKPYWSVPAALVDPSSAMHQLDQSPHQAIQQTPSDRVVLSLTQELVMVSTLWQWHQRHVARKLFRFIPSGFRNVSWRAQVAEASVSVASLDSPAKAELEYVVDTNRWKGGALSPPWTFYFRTVNENNGSSWFQVDLIAIETGTCMTFKRCKPH